MKPVAQQDDLKEKHGWPKRAIDWVEGDTAFVSVPFTWELPMAHARCVFLKSEGYKIHIGGPAVDLMRNYMEEWDLEIEIGGKADALKHHHPDAVFTSRGCPKRCQFCAVPIIEGNLEELNGWESKRIICDNNLLACSTEHFGRVIDSLKGIKGVDFNQGLDAQFLTDHHAARLAELDHAQIRLSWDDVRLESQVMEAIEKLEKVGFHERQIRVYVLVGFNDTPEDAFYRLEILEKRGVWPWPQRFQPLDALVKDQHVPWGWTQAQFKHFIRFWSRRQFWRPVSYEEFR